MSLFPGGFEVGKLPRETRLFINNEWVEGHGTKFNTVNPKDETVIASMDSANAADVDAAVDAATKAFKTFGKSNGCDRRDMLLRLASLVEKHRAQLAELESLDNGKPVHVADGVDIGCAPPSPSPPPPPPLAVFLAIKRTHPNGRKRIPPSGGPSKLARTASRTDGARAIFGSYGALRPLAVCIECYRYYAGWADKIHGSVVHPSGPVAHGKFGYVEKEPVGVVAQIIP